MTSDSMAFKSSPLENLERLEMVYCVMNEVEKLPVHLKGPFMLHYSDGWTFTRIAKRYKLTPSAIHMRVHKAVMKLRRMVNRSGSSIAENRSRLIEASEQHKRGPVVVVTERRVHNKAPSFKEAALQLVSDLELALAEEKADEALGYVARLNAMASGVLELSKRQSE